MIFDRIHTFLCQYTYLFTNMCTDTVQRSLKKNRYIIKEYIKQNETQPLRKLSREDTVLKNGCFVENIFPR